MKRFFLSKKEKKNFVEKIKEKYELSLDTNRIEYMEKDGVKAYLVNGEAAFIVINNELIPHLKWLVKKGHCFLPKIIVDIGAVKPVSRGANIMAPGIRGVKNVFNENTFVVVIDEKHGAPLAIVKSLYKSKEIEKMRKGVVANNIHHIGDKYWKEL